MAQGATSSILQIPAQIPQEQAEHQLEHREGFYLPSLSLPPPSGLETKIPWRFADLNMQHLEEINPQHYYLQGGEEEQGEGTHISVGWVGAQGCVATPQGRLQHSPDVLK